MNGMRRRFRPSLLSAGKRSTREPCSSTAIAEYPAQSRYERDEHSTRPDSCIYGAGEPVVVVEGPAFFGDECSRGQPGTHQHDGAAQRDAVPHLGTERAFGFLRPDDVAGDRVDRE